MYWEYFATYVFLNDAGTNLSCLGTITWMNNFSIKLNEKHFWRPLEGAVSSLRRKVRQQRFDFRIFGLKINSNMNFIIRRNAILIHELTSVKCSDAYLSHIYQFRRDDLKWVATTWIKEFNAPIAQSSVINRRWARCNLLPDLLSMHVSLCLPLNTEGSMTVTYDSWHASSQVTSTQTATEHCK